MAREPFKEIFDRLLRACRVVEARGFPADGSDHSQGRVWARPTAPYSILAPGGESECRTIPQRSEPLFRRRTFEKRSLYHLRPRRRLHDPGPGLGSRRRLLPGRGEATGSPRANLPTDPCSLLSAHPARQAPLKIRSKTQSYFHFLVFF